MTNLFTSIIVTFILFDAIVDVKTSTSPAEIVYSFGPGTGTRDSISHGLNLHCVCCGIGLAPIFFGRAWKISNCPASTLYLCCSTRMTWDQKYSETGSALIHILEGMHPSVINMRDYPLFATRQALKVKDVWCWWSFRHHGTCIACSSIAVGPANCIQCFVLTSANNACTKTRIGTNSWFQCWQVLWARIEKKKIVKNMVD